MGLPEPKIFTRAQLAKRWKCGLPKIGGYIRDGQLKEGFDTFNADYGELRQRCYYKCDAEDEQLLNDINHEEPLSAFVDSVIPENIVSCPRYLYKPIMPNATCYYKPELNQESVWEGITKTMYTLMHIQKYIMFCYFYDLNGSALIPIEEDNSHISFPSITKECRLVIPFEEVERFEIKNKLKRKGKQAPSVTIERKRVILEIIRECGHDPMAFPPTPSGKRGAKTEVRDIYLERHGKTQRNPFDKAWEQLREEGQIKDKSD